MRFVICNAEQRTDAWFRDRLACLTSSNADCVLAKVKNGEAAKRRDEKWRLVVEHLTGKPQISEFSNPDIERGVEREAAAIMAYEAATGHLVERVGFIRMTTMAAGASLDGVVGKFEHLVEVKSPRPANHIATVREDKIPSRYIPQITHQLYVTGTGALDYVSFCPDFPADLSLYIKRITPGELDMEGYERELKAFLAEVQQEVSNIQARKK